MLGEAPQKLRYFSGLSARLLLLTVFFVMLREVFIYAPSVARFRLSYFQERIAPTLLGAIDRAGGTGLGLPIAHDLMRGHGGDIVLGETGITGTLFILTLPVEEQAVAADGPGIRAVDG